MLALLGASDTQAANERYVAHKSTYDEYRDGRSAADLKYFSGIGLAVVGAAGAVAGFFLGAAEPAAPSSVWIVPDLQGLQLAGRF